MVIVELHPRRKHLTALVLDNGETVPLDTAVVSENGLRAGMEVSDALLEGLKEASETRRAKEKALWLLSMRDHSQSELIHKLSRTCSRETAEAVAGRMEEVGLVNDQSYARRLAGDMLHIRKFGMSRVRAELRQKGIDRELIDEILEEIEDDPLPRIRSLLEGKYQKSLSDEKGIARVTAALARRGFQYGDIKAALREYIDMEQEFDE